MADPNELELSQLLQSPTGFQAVTERLQKEVSPKKADPFQSAYDDLNRMTEEAFQEIVNTPLGAQNQMLATKELIAANRQVAGEIEIARNPVNAFGGPELTSVFEQQQTTEFPVDAETFSRRIKLANVLQQALPEKFNELIKTREGLTQENKDLFDRAFDAEFGAFVSDQFSGQPSLRSASEDRFDSPKQQQLWEDFWGDVTPEQGKALEQGQIQEDFLRETKGDAWVDSNLNPTVKLNRQLADSRKFVAGKFGEGIKQWYLGVTTVTDTVGTASTLIPREAVEGVTGQELPAPTLTAGIELATGADRQQQGEFIGQLASALGNETLRPENIFLIATSVGLYASGVGAPAGAAVQGNVIRTVAGRVVTNAMIGGFANSGAAWARDDSQNIQQLADDFVIGAFIEATLPEAMAAYAAVRGTKYSRQAVVEALEGMNAKTRIAAQITDSNLVILDTAPRAATIADVGVSNINPSATHVLDDLDGAVNEAYILAVDGQTNAGRLAQEANELQRRYNNQGKLRDSVRRARAGQGGPVQGADDLVTENMVAMARERAARATSIARDSSKTLNSLSNAVEQRRVAETARVGTAAQGLDNTALLKPDANGVITLSGDETLFRGIDLQYQTPDNPLASPRRGVNVTPQKEVADQFSTKNTTTGATVKDGKVLEVQAKKGLKLLEGSGAEHDRLMEQIVNSPAYDAVPVGQRQQWRDDFMEKAGYQGTVIYKQGMPVVRVFDRNNVKVSAALTNRLAETQKLAKLIENEVSEQGKVFGSLFNDIRDPLQSPYAVRRIAHHIAASVSGRLPGRMQIVADAAINLRRALDELTNPVVETMAKTADSLLRKELNSIRYIGPAKWQKWIDAGYTREIFLSRPDLFAGASPELRQTLRRAQDLGDAKVTMLGQHGYKIEALEGYYFPQFWENDPKAVQQALRGKVSVAKERLYGDVIEGLENGLIPRNMSIRDTLVAHDKMLNQGFGDSAFRNILEQRGIAAKGTPSIAGKTYAFDSPLFKGLVADKRVVQSVDSYFAVPPTSLANVRTFAERVKNTSFGLFDLGVFGIQGTSAIVKGGWLAVVGELTDGMMIRSMPGAARYESETETFWKVLYSRNGGVLGTVSSGYDLEAGTLIGAIPFGAAKKLDRIVTEEYMDRLSRLQFDTALTPVRLSIFKGHLFMQHLLKRDLNDANVLRAAAEAANRATLTSRGAQTSGRRSLESALVTSASSARAEFANIASPLRPLADLVTTGKINGPEAIAAWVGFAHLATMYYGIQFMVNEALGQKQDLFNPMNKDDWKKFGYIRVGNKNIALVKERSILKAMELSFEGLQRQDPEYVAEVWSKVFIGKLSPAVSAVASLGTGYGYDTEGFFQTGELDTRSKLLNFVPFPLAMEKLVLQPTFRSDPVAMTLEFLGFNNYDIGIIDRRDDYLRAHNPYGTDDPRHADVEAHGFGGMERAEAAIFRQEHPEFFDGKNNLPDEQKAAYAEAEGLRTDLLELENEVRSDPFLRREYSEKRKTLMARMGELYAGKKSKDNTMQDKVLSVYYDTLNAFRSQEPGDVFYGDDFGTAEEAARTQITNEYGENGIAALDRALVVGSTQLETEYRTARRSISDSGYYDIADAVIAAKSGGVWASYGEFLTSLDELAKEKGVVAEQLPSFKDAQSVISNAKEKFRERNPQIDAQLVIWDGLTPRSADAQKASSLVLGRNVEISKDVQDRMAREEKAKPANVDFDEIISRFR